MSLIDRVKKILKEAPERTPDNPSGLDFEGQSKKFVKNERDKKKIMRKLSNPSTNSSANLDSQQPLSTTKKGQGSLFKDPGKDARKTRKDKGTTRGLRTKKYGTKTPITGFNKANKEMLDVTGKSAVRDAKKYSKGEYPKVGGGGLKPDLKKPVKGNTPVKTNVSKINVDKIFSGTGNVKKGGNVPDKNISPKSKGSTPVKTNVSKLNVDKVFDKPKNPVTKTKGVKQSEVSKKAKEFTVKVNKKRAQRIKNATGGKKTGSLRKGNLSFPGDRSGAYQSTKSDIETKKLLKKAGGSGDFSPTMPQDKRIAGQQKRDARIKQYKTPDPFEVDTSKAAKENQKIFKNIGEPKRKIYKKIDTPKYQKTGSSFPDPFKSSTPTGSITKGTEFKPKYSGTNPLSTEYAERQVAKNLKKYKKSFKKFSSNLKDFSDRNVPGGPRKIKKKFVGKNPPINNTTRIDVGMAPPDPLIKKGSASSGGGSSSSVGNPKKIKKKFQNNNQSSGSSTSGSGSGGVKPPKTPKASAGGIDPDDAFQGPIKDRKVKYDKKTRKQLKKQNKLKKQEIKQLKIHNQHAKKIRKALKNAKVSQSVSTVAKTGLRSKLLRATGKLGKYGIPLAIAGSIGYDYFKNRGSDTPKLNKGKDMRVEPFKLKSGKSITSIPYKKRTDTDIELTNPFKTSLSNKAFQQMKPGGRYGSKSGTSLYNYANTDERYKDKLRKLSQQRKRTINPYGVDLSLPKK